MNNTFAVLCVASNQLQAWKEHLSELIETLSQQKGTNHFVMFLNTLIALLDTNEDPTGLGNTLKDEYARQWRALVDQLVAIKQQHN